jgi:hypothetical protein
MPQVKSAIPWPNGKAYLFEKQTVVPIVNTIVPGVSYQRYDFATGTLDQGLQPIAPNWPGLRLVRPDAALYWGFGKAYFFYGDEYVRFDLGNNAVDPEYLPPNLPLKIAGNWNIPWTDRIDAAVNWLNGKVYFFRGSEYLRFDITLDRTDDHYPKPIAGNWNGIWPSDIDAALYQGGTKAYFFKDDEFRRFDLVLDNVDQAGPITSLTLDPVPGGMCTPARDLTLDQANRVMGYLIQNGKLSLSPTQTPYNGDWRTIITSPLPSAHVVIRPPTIDGILFENDAGAAPVIDNVDQRMVVALYRFTRWVNASEPDISVVRHKGIGHGAGPPTDCHNQGRALDFSGLDGTSSGSPFDRHVLRDWGNRPVVAGSAMRLDPAVDRLAHDLFRTAHRFGTFECESNGIGPGNRWPAKNIGDVGGFVAHPDYVDEPPPTRPLRAAHQNHIHVQVGPT